MACAGIRTEEQREQLHAHRLSLLAAWLLTTNPVEAATPYWRCSLDRLTVITNGSAARCERLIRTTVRYEQLLVELTGGEPETPMPPKRAHMWAQFGLLTTEERRSQYRELALLMRGGASAAEAVPEAFGMTLDAFIKQYEGGAWQKDASYRLAPRGAPPEVLPAAPVEGAELDAQLKALAARVAEYPDI